MLLRWHINFWILFDNATLFVSLSLFPCFVLLVAPLSNSGTCHSKMPPYFYEKDISELSLSKRLGASLLISMPLIDSRLILKMSKFIILMQLEEIPYIFLSLLIKMKPMFEEINFLSILNNATNIVPCYEFTTILSCSHTGNMYPDLCLANTSLSLFWNVICPFCQSLIKNLGMILRIHFRHQLLNVVILYLIWCVTKYSACTCVAIRNHAYFVIFTIYKDARSSIRENAIGVILIKVASILKILFVICSIFRSLKKIMATFFVIQNFNKEFRICFKSFGKISVCFLKLRPILLYHYDWLVNFWATFI